MPVKYKVTSDFNIVWGVPGHSAVMTPDQVIDLACDYQANVLLNEEEDKQTIKYMNDDLDFMQNTHKPLKKRLDTAIDILNSVAIDVHTLA